MSFNELYDYTFVPKRTVKDRELSFNAIGLYSVMCSYAPGGIYSLRLITNDRGIDEDTAKQLIKELVDYGYLRCFKYKNKDGSGEQTKYVLTAYYYPYICHSRSFIWELK